jgi:hypothetical protein
MLGLICYSSHSPTPLAGKILSSCLQHSTAYGVDDTLSRSKPAGIKRSRTTRRTIEFEAQAILISSWSVHALQVLW